MTTQPWIETYPSAVRWDISIQPQMLNQLLDNTVARFPDLPALQFMGRRISYRELGNLVDRATAGLQQLGVKPGVHVGLYLPNTPHYMIAFFGVLRAGGTVVNYSPLDAAKVLEHKVEDSETDVLITLDLVALYPQMAALLGHTRLKRLIVGSLAEMTAAPDLVAAQMKAAQMLCDVPSDPHHLSFAALLDNEGHFQPLPPTDPTETIAVLQYTGGTTGLPKGAMLTHANLTAAVAQAWETTNGTPRIMEEGQERVLSVLPPFHIYALTINMLFGIRAAAEVVLHARFDVEAVLKDIATHKITCFPGVPTMFTALINYPKLGDYDLRSLKNCGSGGAPLPLEVAQRFHQLTGCHLNEGWGMTETSPTGSFTPARGPRKAGSCGLPMPRVDFKFLDIEDPTRYVALGERGEICVSGPNIMKGYWKQPQATADAMTFDGYFRTGDVGLMDDNGFITIVDRTKDMILCSGYNVYPRNVEEAIYEYPAVAEVIVIGIHDDYRGQAPKAFVTLKAGAAPFSLAELQAFLRDRLGKHEMVQALDIRETLPRTAVGKLSKKELYAEEDRRRSVA